MRASLLLILALAAGCGSSSEKAETNPLREKAVQMFEAFNKHDWEAMAAHYANPAQFLDPSLGKDYVAQTRDEIVTKYKSMESVFPDIRDDVVNVYPSGNTVVVEFVSSGKSAAGTSFRLPIVSVLTFENGLIIKDATYYDN